DSTWYSGGSTRIDDGDPSTTVNNSRLGVTLSLPVGNRSSCKGAYASGVVVRTGTTFTTFAVAWQVLWLTQRGRISSSAGRRVPHRHEAEVVPPPSAGREGANLGQTGPH